MILNKIKTIINEKTFNILETYQQTIKLIQNSSNNQEIIDFINLKTSKNNNNITNLINYEEKNTPLWLNLFNLKDKEVFNYFWSFVHNNNKTKQIILSQKNIFTLKKTTNIDIYEEDLLNYAHCMDFSNLQFLVENKLFENFNEFYEELISYYLQVNKYGEIPACEKIYLEFKMENFNYLTNLYLENNLNPQTNQIQEFLKFLISIIF